MVCAYTEVMAQDDTDLNLTDYKSKSNTILQYQSSRVISSRRYRLIRHVKQRFLYYKSSCTITQYF